MVGIYLSVREFFNNRFSQKMCSKICSKENKKVFIPIQGKKQTLIVEIPL